MPKKDKELFTADPKRMPAEQVRHLDQIGFSNEPYLENEFQPTATGRESAKRRLRREGTPRHPTNPRKEKRDTA